MTDKSNHKSSNAAESQSKIAGLRMVTLAEALKGLDKQKTEFWKRKKAQDDQDLKEFEKRIGLEK